MTLFPPIQFLIMAAAGWLGQRQQHVIEYLLEENGVLREKVGGKRLRFTDSQRRRLARRARLLTRKQLEQFTTVATPDTLVRWYRKLVAQKYDGSAKRGPGRPRVAGEIERLVVRLATENPRWGYTRIRDVMWHVGYTVSRSSVARILKEQGLEPAPVRSKRTTWAEFLGAHWGEICATDFFTVEVLTLAGLVRYQVLFVMELKTRRVEIVGVVHEAYELWMVQMARNLTDVFCGFLVGKRVLIHDRDPLFSKRFCDTLAAADVETKRLPARSPNLNAYAERFVRSIKEECLSNVIPLSERHLRSVISEYMVHYHAERPHQGLGGRLIEGQPESGTGTVQRKSRLGGMLNHYYRAAA